MKNIFLYGFYLFLVSCSQNNRNDLSDLELNGKVESLRVSFFEVNEENGNQVRKKINERYSKFNRWGNLDEETWYESDKIQRKLIYTSNVKGKKIELNVYSKDGLEGQFKYFYGRNGKLLSYEEEYDSDSVFVRRILYRYDRNENLTGTYWILPDSSVFSRIIFKNDSRGNPVEIYQRSKEEKVSTHYRKYDKNNNMVEDKTYNAVDSLVATTKVIYDKWNNVIEQFVNYDLAKGSPIDENMKSTLQDNVIIYCDYLYDNHHNILQKSIFDSERKFQSMEKYRYDSMNNWLNLEIYSQDKKLIRVVDRQIAYYEEPVN